eukprot:TRINITY_DN6907_c1_g1_i2.p1 TRINITY_DN6907_c1_g1~~TRINITY_DN6907_c1_g1_i2.p1  ORF type:complete len:272 (-),score=30.35 TRINITY_DN6907_c1_g1_i2:259-1074(-)
MIARVFLAFSQFVTYEDYCWALMTIWSRAMDFPVEGSNQHMRCVVPFMDLFNTAVDAPLSHALDLDRKVLMIIAQKGYRIGEEITISYGDRIPNHQLVLFYGFALDSPKHHQVELYVPFNPQDPLFELRKQLLGQISGSGDGEASQKPYLLTNDNPLPLKLLQSVEIQGMTHEVLLGAGVELSEDQTQQEFKFSQAAIDALESAINAMLQQYNQDCRIDAQDSDNSRTAKILVQGEKDILLEALSRLRQLRSNEQKNQVEQSQEQEMDDID